MGRLIRASAASVSERDFPQGSVCGLQSRVEVAAIRVSNLEVHGRTLRDESGGADERIERDRLPTRRLPAVSASVLAKKKLATRITNGAMMVFTGPAARIPAEAPKHADAPSGARGIRAKANRIRVRRASSLCVPLL